MEIIFKKYIFDMGNESDKVIEELKKELEEKKKK